MEMKKNVKQPQDGSVPITIMNQLNEHTAGGFVLFYFNSETGAPEEIMTFDTPAHSLALQKHIADWTYALQELNVDSEKANFISSASKQGSHGDDNSDDVVL